MMPFILSWIGLFSLPALLWIKDKRKLAAINNIFFFIGYSFVTPFLVAIFVVVNLLLLPLAYVKTSIHKANLVYAYRGKSQCLNLGFFLLLGIPLLLAA